MKRIRMLITYLHFDVLKHIMIIVAKSSDGAANLARAISVCRVFMKLSEDRDVLKAVVFDNVRLSDRYELFQQINGLLNRCAHAGNVKAQYMIAKTILVSSSQLLAREKEYALSSKCRFRVDQGRGRKATKEDTLASSFMAYSTEEPACSSKVSGGSLRHFELVRLFLCQCGPYDLVEMRIHLNHYIEHFIGSERGGYLRFFDSINKMCMYVDCIRSFEIVKRKSREMKDRIDAGVRVTGELIDRLDASISVLEVLKDRLVASVRIMGELVKGKREFDVKSLDLEERYGAYIAEFNKSCAILKELRIERRDAVVELEASFYARMVEEFHKAGVEAVMALETTRANAISEFDRLFP